jgi:hypothetical protein
MNRSQHFALACWAGAVAATVGAVLLPRGEYMAEGPPTYAPLDLAALSLSTLAALLLVVPTLHASSGLKAPRWFEVIAMLLAMLMALAGALCVIIAPPVFTFWVKEDRIAEWVSAGAAVAGGIVLVTALHMWRSVRPIPSARLRVVFLSLLALLLLLIGLEEVSWFQRQLGFTTPQWFDEHNGQHEVNFHNLQTSFFENAYYLSAALLLAGGRLLLHSPWHGRSARWLVRFAPGWTAFALGVIAVAYNWDMFRIVNIQVAFALGTFVAVTELMCAVRGRLYHAAGLLGVLAAVALAVQAVFLVWGHTLTREWDATEAKEMFIALGLLAYAIEQASQLRSDRA